MQRVGTRRSSSAFGEVTPVRADFCEFVMGFLLSLIVIVAVVDALRHHSLVVCLKRTSAASA